MIIIIIDIIIIIIMINILVIIINIIIITIIIMIINMIINMIIIIIIIINCVGEVNKKLLRRPLLVDFLKKKHEMQFLKASCVKKRATPRRGPSLVYHEHTGVHHQCLKYFAVEMGDISGSFLWEMPTG